MLLIVFLIVFVMVVYVFMLQPKFGSLPTGESLKRVQSSPNFTGQKFQNLNLTPDLTEGVSMLTVLYEFIFTRSKRVRPTDNIPFVKTNLQQLSAEEDVLVWFGHSSYFMQIEGLKMLVDPVFSGAASPLPGSVKSFVGSNEYSVDDLPLIDVLFITHDHWDHLDFDTVTKLKSKVKLIITGLGTAAHLKRWGFEASMIIEKDWNEKIILKNGFVVNTLPARHFSGRGFKRQQSLWMSFALQTNTKKIFIGGDSGYDTHFAEIGKRFGPFDLAILECGQYNKNWKYIHSTPEEVMLEVKDLQAKKLLAVHWGKFVLAQHAWDEPIREVSKLSAANNVPLLTPMIGEKVELNNHSQQFTRWWENVN